jgi:hypothetical protein
VTAQELLALADRCEKASGADRELDVQIGAAVWGRPGVLVLRQEVISDIIRAPTEYSYWEYTSSIDAALTLVPEGWWLDIQTAGVSGVGAVSREWPVIKYGRDEGHGERTQARTLALALCTAALRARARGES